VTFSHAKAGLRSRPNNPNFLATVLKAGITDGVADEVVQFRTVTTYEIAQSDEQPPPDTFFGGVQPRRHEAPDAWALGCTGQGARVAILDGGIHSTHIDIAPNLDVARSRSFVPGKAFNFDESCTTTPPITCSHDTFWHGTHVAGIVAAPDNGLGTIGIAPQATIIGVKVLNMELARLLLRRHPTPRRRSLNGAERHPQPEPRHRPVPPRASVGAVPVVHEPRPEHAHQQGARSDRRRQHGSITPATTPWSRPRRTSAVSAPPRWALGAADFERQRHLPAARSDVLPRVAISRFGRSAVLTPRIPSGTTACWVFDMVMSTRGRGLGLVHLPPARAWRRLRPRPWQRSSSGRIPGSRSRS
jgi:hypothetical protein